MANPLEEPSQTGMFEDDNLSAQDFVPDWKAVFLDQVQAKASSPLAVIGSTPAKVKEAGVAQEWMDETGDAPPVVKPLKLQKCTRSECNQDLHCFRLTKKLAKQKQLGQCRTCDALPVDFPRVQKRDLADLNYTFASLKYEWIRYEYWTREFDPKALNYAKRKGMNALLSMVEHQIKNAVGRPLSQNKAFDGRQTSWEGNPIHYAQHATATCCRRCLEMWHGIPLEDEISPTQLTYLSTLAKEYLKERFKGKDIRPHPVSVSPMRPGDESTLRFDFTPSTPDEDAS